MAGLPLALALQGASAHHVTLFRADPLPGARLAVAPSAVEIELDRAVLLPGSNVQVTDALGRRVDVGATTRVGGADDRLSVPLVPLRPGQYIVTWRVTGQSDYEFNEGSYSFSVAADSGATRAAGVALVLLIAGALGLLAEAGVARGAGQQ